jgi:hypothetical protein
MLESIWLAAVLPPISSLFLSEKKKERNTLEPLRTHDATAFVPQHLDFSLSPSLLMR